MKASQLTPELLAWQYLEKLPELANKDGNTVWMVPSQFGDSLESFARAFGKADEDGVFRYEPPAVTAEAKEEADRDKDEDWFDMSSNPEIARAVAAANEVANRPVEDPALAAQSKRKSVAEAEKESPIAGENGSAPSGRRRDEDRGLPAGGYGAGQPGVDQAGIGQAGAGHPDLDHIQRPGGHRDEPGHPGYQSGPGAAPNQGGGHQGDRHGNHGGAGETWRP